MEIVEYHLYTSEHILDLVSRGDLGKNGVGVTGGF